MLALFDRRAYGLLDRLPGAMAQVVVNAQYDRDGDEQDDRYEYTDHFYLNVFHDVSSSISWEAATGHLCRTDAQSDQFGCMALATVGLVRHFGT